MSECRKGFAKPKGDIIPAARGDAKWRGAVWSLPWRWISVEMVWGVMPWGWVGWGAEHSHRIFASFPLFCFENGRNGNCETVSEDAR